MRIDVEINDSKVQAALQRLIDAGGDMTPAMREIAGILTDASERAFAEQRDPATGEPWAELSDVTRERREKTGHWPGSILQLSGGLARSIQQDYGTDFALAGTNAAHATTHQLGAQQGEFGVFSIVSGRQVPLPWGDIPARPFFGVGPDDEDEILEALSRHLARAFQG